VDRTPGLAWLRWPLGLKIDGTAKARPSIGPALKVDLVKP